MPCSNQTELKARVLDLFFGVINVSQRINIYPLHITIETFDILPDVAAIRLKGIALEVPRITMRALGSALFEILSLLLFCQFLHAHTFI